MSRTSDKPFIVDNLIVKSDWQQGTDGFYHLDLDNTDDKYVFIGFSVDNTSSLEESTQELSDLFQATYEPNKIILSCLSPVSGYAHLIISSIVYGYMVHDYYFPMYSKDASDPDNPYAFYEKDDSHVYIRRKCWITDEGLFLHTKDYRDQGKTEEECEYEYDLFLGKSDTLIELRRPEWKEVEGHQQQYIRLGQNDYILGVYEFNNEASSSYKLVYPNHFITYAKNNNKIATIDSWNIIDGVVLILKGEEND